MSIRFKDITNSSDTLTFGKYRGRTYEDVIKLNPEYLLWCHAHQILSLENSLYQEIYTKVIQNKMRTVRTPRYDNRYGMMPDYDTDMLGDWFDDVPF